MYVYMCELDMFNILTNTFSNLKIKNISTALLFYSTIILAFYFISLFHVFQRSSYKYLTTQTLLSTTTKKIINQQQKRVKKIPKGWSDYQAAWIPDDDAEFASNASDDGSDNDSNEYMDAVSEEKSDYSDAEDNFDLMTESEVAANDQQYDEQTDANSEKEDLAKIKAAKTDQMFPDEVDTPQDTPARIRFQKYRGLESFR